MTSIKSLLNRMGVPTTEPISLSQNLFGFLRGVVPDDPDPSVTARVSVRQQIENVGGKHIHLNVILVGFDQIADLDEALERVDYAIYRIHNIYRQVGIGIGRVEYYDIPSAQAGGADDIGSEGEADELSDDWSVFNRGIDVLLSVISAIATLLASHRSEGVVIKSLKTMASLVARSTVTLKGSPEPLPMRLAIS
jgi:hypothetical protein